MIDTRNVLMDFTNELRSRIEYNGLTYRQVAFEARITRTKMNEYKFGRTFPELWNLLLIADCLDCSIDELLGYSKTGFAELRNSKVRVINVMPNNDVFADFFRMRLERYMQNNRITVADLSKRSGFKESTLEMYLSVHRWVPRTADFIKLCDSLDCTPSNILGY